VATLSVIRRWALREQLSIREIARRTGLSRNTVKKYLRADTVEPEYAKRRSPSKLDPFSEKLATWLKTETTKSRKQRRTLKQMHADLVALGFQGSYNRVAAFSRSWTARRQEVEQTVGRGTFVPLVFSAGEAFQFDWSEDWAIIGGERTKLQVAHFKLSHSRAFMLRAYLSSPPLLPSFSSSSEGEEEGGRGRGEEGRRLFSPPPPPFLLLLLSSSPVADARNALRRT
jgi:transposase